MEISQLIIFQLMNVAFGVRSDQIFEIFNPVKFADRDGVAYQFDRIIPFGNKKPVKYREPKVITPAPNHGNCGIKIEAPDDIISVSSDKVKALPALIAGSNISKAFYGVITHNKQLVLLIDFFRLLAEARQRC